MTGYAAMAARGREEARRRAKLARVTVAFYVWREAPTLVGHWVEPCPPFTTERQWRVDTVGEHWECDAMGSCGHVLAFVAHGVQEGVVPAYLERKYPQGKRTPCEQCPPPADPEESAPPDEERCAYDSVGGEEVGWRRCTTRARWSVAHEAPNGTRTEASWPRLCERHRRSLLASGHLMPEPLPHPYGYEDGGRDVVEPIPRPHR